MDWFVLLTPLLVLAVIALLGFTGCDLVFVVNPPAAELSLEVRVPSAFTVQQVRFEWTRPGANTPESTETPERKDEGPDITVLFTRIAEPELGSWSAGCRLQVRDGAAQAADVGTGLFVLDAESPNKAAARFETSGSPSTNDFKVLFTGVVNNA
jgi:hypothetical protein